jgi:predicted DNA-binding helix-hairpin-helix protein
MSLRRIELIKQLFYNWVMDAIEKLILTRQNMSLEVDDERHGAPRAFQTAAEPVGMPSCFSPQRSTGGMPAPRDLPIHDAVLPGGGHIRLLKTMLTTACERDCYYCAFRAGRNYRRATLKPDEMADAFSRLYRAGIVQGLFLSSGVAGGGVRTEDRLIDTVEILRAKLGFRGYIHLKIMPGVERAQVERVMQLADRVSVNLEAPNSARLARLAPHKTFIEELLQPLRWIEEIRRTERPFRTWNGRWPSSCTQFVAGGAGESDLELLGTTAWLHRNVGLARAYFSRFNPIADTPLENQQPTNPWREHRLYQASYLLRDYGFDMEELPFTPSGDLPLESDPKLLWARTNLREAPIELNRAERFQLMRIPGIGPKGAAAIMTARRMGKLRDPRDLRILGIRVERALPYVLFDGRRPPQQLSLW